MKSFASPEMPEKYSCGKQKSRRTMFEHVSSRLSSRNGETPLRITYTTTPMLLQCVKRKNWTLVLLQQNLTESYFCFTLQHLYASKLAYSWRKSKEMKHNSSKTPTRHLSLVWTSFGYCIILYMITELSHLLPKVQDMKFLYDKSYWSYVIIIIIIITTMFTVLSL